MAKKTRRKTIARELTLEVAINEAHSDIEGLAQEVREVFDNMPESTQSGQRGETLNSTAETLEGLSEPSVDDKLGFLKFEYVERVRTPKQMAKQSRSSRRDDAVELLGAVSDFLQEVIDDSDPACREEARKVKLLDGKTSDELDAIHELADSLRDEVESYKDEAEQVEFPGMFG